MRSYSCLALVAQQGYLLYTQVSNKDVFVDLLWWRFECRDVDFWLDDVSDQGSCNTRDQLITCRLKSTRTLYLSPLLSYHVTIAIMSHFLHPRWLFDRLRTTLPGEPLQYPTLSHVKARLRAQKGIISTPSSISPQRRKPNFLF